MICLVFLCFGLLFLFPPFATADMSCYSVSSGIVAFLFPWHKAFLFLSSVLAIVSDIDSFRESSFAFIFSIHIIIFAVNAIRCSRYIFIFMLMNGKNTETVKTVMHFIGRDQNICQGLSLS